MIRRLLSWCRRHKRQPPATEEAAALERINCLLQAVAEDPSTLTFHPTHRVIDGPRNDDTPYFFSMRGQEVYVHAVDGGGFARGLIIESGLPFDGWKIDRLEPLRSDWDQRP